MTDYVLIPAAERLRLYEEQQAHWPERARLCLRDWAQGVEIITRLREELARMHFPEVFEHKTGGDCKRCDLISLALDYSEGRKEPL